MAIFSGVILSLAGLAYQIARRSTRATDQALIMGRLLSKVDVAAQVPFDSLDVLTGCDTTMNNTVKVIGCYTVNAISPRTSTVTVVVRTSVPGSRIDTIILQRSRYKVPIPLR